MLFESQNIEMLLGYISSVSHYFEKTNQQEHHLKLEADLILERAGWITEVYCVYCGDPTETPEEAEQESHRECREGEEEG